jgi:hypothetical protein
MSYIRIGREGTSETSVHARSTRRHIPENVILHNQRVENLKSHMAVFHPDILEPRITKSAAVREKLLGI